MADGMFLEGYDKARQSAEVATLEELLATIDTLYGRGKLKYGDDIEAVRREALIQIKLEFANMNHPETVYLSAFLRNMKRERESYEGLD